MYRKWSPNRTKPLMVLQLVVCIVSLLGSCMLLRQNGGNLECPLPTWEARYQISVVHGRSLIYDVTHCSSFGFFFLFLKTNFSCHVLLKKKKVTWKVKSRFKSCLRKNLRGQTLVFYWIPCGGTANNYPPFFVHIIYADTVDVSVNKNLLNRTAAYTEQLPLIWWFDTCVPHPSSFLSKRNSGEWMLIASIHLCQTFSISLLCSCHFL